ncbi:hypothetical protein F3N42_08780 [Marinihelvus fidelis]|uniref:Outer membrane lipoprotein carrier protein LolA n=1 Tax=Marinihelvus fidelis TaxID=2613842 RepID=A0A5N0T8R1_9GAMM|nr:LolA-related protein [Marinihelvus fidelis]KAA9131405.1 hypothetical protein F3N42_08780 [Marinihelvus fidelis]
MSHRAGGRRPTIPERAKRLLLCVVLALAPNAGAVAAGADGDVLPPDPAMVARLSGLAADSSDVLHYRETREGGLFSGPVTYTGRLQWLPDIGELVQWVDSPSRARLSVLGDRVEIQGENGRARSLPLSGRPGLGAMMAGLKALLSGDVDALGAVFLADYLEAGDGQWTLHLKPRDEALREHLALLEVRGQDNQLVAIDRVDARGTRQAMIITDGPASP